TMGDEQASAGTATDPDEGSRVPGGRCRDRSNSVNPTLTPYRRRLPIVENPDYAASPAASSRRRPHRVHPAARPTAAGPANSQASSSPSTASSASPSPTRPSRPSPAPPTRPY